MDGMTETLSNKHSLSETNPGLDPTSSHIQGDVSIKKGDFIGRDSIDSSNSDFVQGGQVKNVIQVPKNESVIVAIIGIVAIVTLVLTQLSAYPADKPTEQNFQSPTASVTGVTTVGKTLLVDAQRQEVDHANSVIIATATSAVIPIPKSSLSWANPIDKSIYVHIPEGGFIMGSEEGDADERPQHKVYLDDYWIMKTEVTNAQYQKFIYAGGYTNPDYWDEDAPEWLEKKTKPSCWDDHTLNKSQHPVVCVSWREAKAYTLWLSAMLDLEFGLPTEAQWEKAARGPDGYLYPWGNDWDGTKLNFCDKSCPTNPVDKNLDDGYPYTAPVGSYPSGISPYKLLDMAGNVWEWTSDWYGEEYYSHSPERDPLGPANGEFRVIRGGSWNYTRQDFRVANRVTNRGLYHGGLREGVGFRVRLSSLDSE